MKKDNFIKRRVIVPVVFVICLALFLFLPAGCLSASTSTSIDNVDVEAKINKEGEVSVNQVINYSGTSNYLYWIIPYKDVSDIKISQGNRTILPSKIKKEDQRTLVFWPIEDSDLLISKINFNYKLKGQVDMRGDKEVIQLIYLKEPGIDINQIEFKLSYPDSIGKAEQRYYAIHGIKEANLMGEEENSFRYQVDNVSSFGILSFDLLAPKGSFDIGFREKVKNFFTSLSPQIILLISILIPLIVYFYLFTFYRRHIYTKQLGNSAGTREGPPSKLSPALVDILLRGRLTTRGVGAFILNLLIKGYLTLVEKEDRIIIGKIKEADEKLSGPEKAMMRILFKRKELKGGLNELSAKKKKEIFDTLVDSFYQFFEKKVNREKLFIGNSQQVKNRVLKIGIGVFFVSVLLALFLLVYLPQSPWLSIAPISIIVASLIIIRMRSYLTIKSAKGQEELVKWLKFKNYLKKDAPVKGADRRTFQRLLPWAYLFKVIDRWVSKFSRYPMSSPDWYVSVDQGQTIEDRIDKTKELIDELAQEISNLKPPKD